ncbi:MAG: OsmC family protein [Bacteroidetes bacterium]|nr:OsmC family protein [Bacteroidota bacterium]MBS1931245.1 OsmC family protein [Bacteroidota bacterium]
MIKTITRWKKDHEFEAEHHGNKISMDGAVKNGHGPKALLLSALAGCSGIDLVDILTKMRVPFFSLEIEVETTQTEEPPKVFNDIVIHYKIQTDREYEKKVKKAINLSLEKYCGVAAMLKKNSTISYHLSIEP